MQVKDLIAKLNACDQKLEVVCYSEDEGMLAPGHGFRLLEIESVDICDAQKTRGEDQIPTMKLGKGEYSVHHVFLNVTSEF